MFSGTKGFQTPILARSLGQLATSFGGFVATCTQCTCAWLFRFGSRWKQVGRELGVRYVLEGSVRKAGGRVRITAQLIDATNGAHLWADHFDDSLEDVFDLQDKVAINVAGVIEPALQSAEAARSANRSTNDLTAYDFYLRVTRWLLRRCGNPLKRCASWRQRFRVIRVTGAHWLALRSAVFG
jgi:hypothetical protein